MPEVYYYTSTAFGTVDNWNHAHLLNHSLVLLGVLVDQMLVHELWSLEELRTMRNNI